MTIFAVVIIVVLIKNIVACILSTAMNGVAYNMIALVLMFIVLVYIWMPEPVFDGSF